MSKIIDITDKLNFEERPRIKIRGVEIEVDNRATTILKLTDIFSEQSKNKALRSTYELIFDKEGKKYIDSLALSWKNFETLVMSAVDVILDREEKNEGETQTPATT